MSDMKPVSKLNIYEIQEGTLGTMVIDFKLRYYRDNGTHSPIYY